jgi:hypothetical protein
MQAVWPKATIRFCASSWHRSATRAKIEAPTTSARPLAATKRRKYVAMYVQEKNGTRMNAADRKLASSLQNSSDPRSSAQIRVHPRAISCLISSTGRENLSR